MRERVKIICLFLIALLVCPVEGAAQKVNSDFYFIYIAHDRATPVQRLSKALQDLYDDAVKYGHSCIFYLANNDAPYVVNINTENDNRNEFSNQIIAELQNKIAHGINPRFDVDNIVAMFNENDYLLNDQELKYTSVTWNFYTSEWFWKEGYNESLIASLYWIMGVENTQDLDFYFNVFHSSDDELELEDGLAFGRRNLLNINTDCFLLDY